MSDAAQEGFPVVLTADRTLMARYRLLLDGMVSAAQTTAVPETLWRLLMAPGLNGDGVRAVQAPMGLRRVEAALLAEGFSPEEVAVVVPENLHRAVGPRTRIIGVSSADPLGIGMNSSTMTALLGGEILCGAHFKRLVEQISAITDHGAQVKPAVVMGGAGAWQLAAEETARHSLGIDHVICGYCEDDIAETFGCIIERPTSDPVVQCSVSSVDAIPAIRGATIMGIVEISRGCGMGCHFCTLGRVPMQHLPVDVVLRDIETNLAAGVKNISLISEDFLRYGAAGRANAVAPEELKKLLRAVRELPDLGLVQVDHANVTSVAAFNDADLTEVHDLLAGGSSRDWLWVNLGVETASGELLQQNGGAAKMRPFGAEEWADVCREQVRRSSRAGFLPMVSLVVGMPGETEKHIRRTIDWVESLKGERAAVFPVLYVAADGRGRHFSESDMTPLHWRLFEVSYRLNFKWTPQLYREGQVASGVSLCTRALMGALGRIQAIKLGKRIARLAKG